MDIKLTFLGAAQNVTGSCYLLEANGQRFIIDAGMYQERDFVHRNWDPFPVDLASIDAVLLTHAHLDHCGRLPKLVKDGYAGPIYATSATTDIADIIMRDSAYIQEEDVRFKKMRHERAGKTSPHPYEPLYTGKDAEAAAGLFKVVDYETPVRVGDGVEAEFFEVGHILGSTCIRVRVTQGGESRTVLFSGDVGRWNLPIMRDPAPVTQADYVVVESTYGNRTHETTNSIPDQLADVVNRTRARGGNIVIPSFAVERTQELLYHLNHLLAADRIPHLIAFVDSPMAVRVTEVFRRHPHLFDENSRELLRQGRHPCDFPGLTMSRTVDQSKAINHIQGTVLIIAGSGMCTGGRIKHHLRHNIADERNTVLFVGYQASGTLGRLIVDGTETVRIQGEELPVRAEIARINGFSAHADRDELKRWLSAIENTPRRVLVTHGEKSVAESFVSHLRDTRGWDVIAPAYQDVVALD